MPVRLLIVTPAYNEELGLPLFFKAFSELKARMASDAELRLLVVNDGSQDQTESVLREAVKAHPGTVDFLSLAGNFGHAAALVAGLSEVGAWANCVVTMDCDLEHPMAVVPRMVELWRTQRLSIVNTLRESSARLPLSKRLFSKLFYVVTAKLTGLNLSSGQADFCLWDAHVLRGVQPYLKNVASLRVFRSWIPGPKGEIRYQQEVIEDRVSRFTFKKNWDLAINGIVRFSSLPLRVIWLLGLTGIVGSTLYAIYICYQTFRGEVVRGWPSVILTVLLMGCLQLSSIGILASYLRRLVFAKDLPLYLVRDRSFTRDAGSRDTSESLFR